jgi:hypothetical protein
MGLMPGDVAAHYETLDMLITDAHDASGGYVVISVRHDFDGEPLLCRFCDLSRVQRWRRVIGSEHLAGLGSMAVQLRYYNMLHARRRSAERRWLGRRSLPGTAMRRWRTQTAPAYRPVAQSCDQSRRMPLLVCRPLGSKPNQG